MRNLHAAKLAHCDITPANIVRMHGRWLLLDLDACSELGSVLETKIGGECVCVRGLGEGVYECEG